MVGQVYNKKEAYQAPVFTNIIRSFYFISERPGTMSFAVKHREYFPVYKDGTIAVPNTMVAAVGAAVRV